MRIIILISCMIAVVFLVSCNSSSGSKNAGALVTKEGLQKFQGTWLVQI